MVNICKLKLTSLQQEILRLLFIKTGIKLNQRQIANYLKVSQPAVMKALPGLEDLIKIKEAELYRVNTFSDLLQTLQDDLNTGDVDQINRDYENLAIWSDSPENSKSLDIQAELLKQFGILPEEVDFNWTRPEIESDKKLPTA